MDKQAMEKQWLQGIKLLFPCLSEFFMFDQDIVISLYFSHALAKIRTLLYVVLYT